MLHCAWILTRQKEVKLTTGLWRKSTRASCLHVVSFPMSENETSFHRQVSVKGWIGIFQPLDQAFEAKNLLLHLLSYKIIDHMMCSILLRHSAAILSMIVLLLCRPRLPYQLNRPHAGRPSPTAWTRMLHETWQKWLPSLYRRDAWVKYVCLQWINTACCAVREN